MTEPSADDLNALEVRVGNGITWLSEHDPLGAYHLWFEAGILPGTPMPAQSEEVQAEYATYFRHRTTWERLDAELARREGRPHQKPGYAPQWDGRRR